MKTFVCRVELLGTPGVLVYLRLHTAMEKLGFKRSFPSGGERFAMPPGMYIAYSRSALSPLNERVMKATKVLWTDRLVLTMEVEDMEGFLLFAKLGS